MEQLTQGKKTQEILQGPFSKISQELWNIILDNLSLREILTLRELSKSYREKTNPYIIYNPRLGKLHSNMEILFKICVQGSQNNFEKLSDELFKALKKDIQLAATALLYPPACEIVVCDGSSCEIGELIDFYQKTAKIYLLEKGEMPGYDLKEKQEEVVDNIFSFSIKQKTIEPDLVWAELFKKNNFKSGDPAFITAAFFYPPSNEELKKYDQRIRNIIKKHQKFVEEFLKRLYDEMLKKDMDEGWKEVNRIKNLAQGLPENMYTDDYFIGELDCRLDRLARGIDSALPRVLMTRNQ